MGHHHPTPFPSQPPPPKHNPTPEEEDDDIPAWAYTGSDDEADPPSQNGEGPSNYYQATAEDDDIPDWAYDRSSDDEAEGGQSEFRGRMQGGEPLPARRMSLDWGRDLIPEGSGADKGKGRAKF
jgi:hypothetical protein